MRALIAAGLDFARPQRLKDSGAFLLGVWSAVGPHVPALWAGQPPWNHREKVFHAMVVAPRAFGPWRIAHAQRHDLPLCAFCGLCDLIFHDALTNLNSVRPKRTQSTYQDAPSSAWHRPAPPPESAQSHLQRTFRSQCLKCMSAQAFAAWSLQSQSWAMRVTIVNKPAGALGGMWLQRLQVGQTYNLDPAVANNLLMPGYAIKENRWGERRQAPRPGSPGRRRTDGPRE
jgi:hypothetical protein